GINVPEIYDAFVKPSIVEIARDARFTGSLICLVKNFPKNTVMPTGERKKATDPRKLPNAAVFASFRVRIRNGLGRPFSFLTTYKGFSLLPNLGILCRTSGFNTSNNLRESGPIVMAKKNDINTVVSSGTMSNPQYQWRNPCVNIAKGIMIVNDNRLFLDMS